MPGTGCYAALLTAQGRMIADMRVLETGDARPDRFCTTGAATPVKDKLEQFIFSEDAQVEDLTERLAIVGVYGPQAAAIVEHALESHEPLDSLALFEQSPAGDRRRSRHDRSQRRSGRRRLRHPRGEACSGRRVDRAPSNEQAQFASVTIQPRSRASKRDVQHGLRTWTKAPFRSKRGSRTVRSVCRKGATLVRKSSSACCIAATGVSRSVSSGSA